MCSLAIAAVCGIILLTAAPGIKMETCISDRACADPLNKASVWFGGNLFPMFFGCENAPEGTTDAHGNSCAKKITKCCRDVLKKDDACALVGRDQSAIFNFNGKEGPRFCVTCKATGAPVVTRMSNRPFEVCRAEGEKVLVNKCTFAEAGICIPVRTYALHRKDGFYDPVLICRVDGNEHVFEPLRQPKGDFRSLGRPEREALSHERACYRNSDGAVETVLKKCKFTYDGKSVCVQEGHVLVIPGNADKYAAFTCPAAMEAIGVRLSMSEYAAEEVQLRQSLKYVANEVSFEKNPAAQCYGM